MRISRSAGNIVITTKVYKLIIDQPQLLARLYAARGNMYYHMSLLSAVDKVGQIDKTHTIQGIRSRRKGDCCVIEITHSSSLWKEKKTQYTCYEEYIEYGVSVKGNGRVDRAYFFRGRLGQDELASVPGYDYLFPACPNFLEKDYFHASEYCSINAGHESFAWGFALSTGPLCFALANKFKAPWLSIGVAAGEGEYGFQSFEYNHKSKEVEKTPDSIVGTSAFSLAYYGHLRVKDSWCTPKLVFHFAGNEFAAIRKYVNWLFDNRYLKKTRRKKASWWKQPIFCGWREQVAAGFGATKGNFSRQHMESGKAAKAQCTQKNHERWLRRLHKKGIDPGIIIIDADWHVPGHQADKKKWPDLRGFIDNCHAQGQKVLLWIDCWEKGLATNDERIAIGGQRNYCDPTNPAYIKRLRCEMERMLSNAPECYNADGLKVDNTSMQPYGYDMKTKGDLYGYELQKHYMKIIYDAVKSIKKDALVSLFIANPYCLDVCDMVRIGDMYTAKGDPGDAMRTRAKIIRIGMPGVLIDTDGQFSFSMEPDFAKLITEQAKVGLPTIYNADRVLRLRSFCLPAMSKLTDKDYQQIAKNFKQ